MDDLLLLLKKAGFGYYIGAHFVGALDYADDIVLVASATALREILVIFFTLPKTHRNCKVIFASWSFIYIGIQR